MAATPAAPSSKTQKRRLNAGVLFGIVIASDAKQSIASTKERMDCFVASLLAMTAKKR
jgi:hypothetical protein